MYPSSTKSEEPALQPKGCEIVIDPKGRGMTLIVPPIGFRRAPKTPFVFAVLWLGITALFTVSAASSAVGNLSRMEASGWIGLAVFLSVFWLAGLFLAAIAIQAACTRTIMTLRDAFFSLTLEGPFRTSRQRWLLTDLEGFTIERSNQLQDRRGRAFPRLRIQLKHWKRGTVILAGRKSAELRWVAAVMSQALEEARRQNPQPSPDVLDQPAGSRAILERGSNGLMVKLPALGFHGAIPFVTVGGMLVGTALMAGSWAGANMADRPSSLSTWLGICITMGLGLFALAVAVEAIGYAIRRDELTVKGQALTVSHTTWRGGVRAKEWRRSQIAAIDVDVGTNPLPRVRIHLVSGSIQRLLIYHNEDELLWIATHLREVLQVPAALPR